MQIDAIGLKGSGKSALVGALSGDPQAYAASRSGGPIVVKIPDPRVDRLSEMFRPKKTTHAEIHITEIPWSASETSRRRSEAESYLKRLAGAELFIQVVRGFESPLHEVPADVARDRGRLDEEMILNDLAACEALVERETKRREDLRRVEILEKCRACLEGEAFLSGLQLDERDLARIAGYSFTTLVPQLVVINAPQGTGETPEDPHGRLHVTMDLGVAAEVAALDPEEQAEFAAEMGLELPPLDLIARESYRALDLISFFTVSESEVHAWTIPAGTTARKAAGKVHTDMERGFIRAEVVDFDTLSDLGSLPACRDKGLLRVEGKDYVLKDGEIMYVRFSV